VGGGISGKTWVRKRERMSERVKEREERPGGERW
jgi:hypothetical protein